MRSGTENTAGIAGFGKAADISAENFSDRTSAMNLCPRPASLRSQDRDKRYSGKQSGRLVSRAFGTERVLSRHQRRGAAPFSRTGRHICFHRFSLLFKQEGAEPRLVGHGAFAERDREHCQIQLQRIQYCSGDGLRYRQGEAGCRQIQKAGQFQIRERDHE